MLTTYTPPWGAFCRILSLWWLTCYPIVIKALRRVKNNVWVCLKRCLTSPSICPKFSFYPPAHLSVIINPLSKTLGLMLIVPIPSKTPFPSQIALNKCFPNPENKSRNNPNPKPVIKNWGRLMGMVEKAMTPLMRAKTILWIFFSKKGSEVKLFLHTNTVILVLLYILYEFHLKNHQQYFPKYPHPISTPVQALAWVLKKWNAEFVKCERVNTQHQISIQRSS